MKQSFLYTILFTFVLCFIFVLLLALTNEATRAQVLLNAELEQQRAILSAFGIEYANDDEVQAQFSTIEQLSRGDVTLYRTEINGEVRYAKQFSGAGLWGTIYGVISVYESLDRVAGIEIIDNNETPGLGARIDETWFKEQFRDERIINNQIEVRPGDGSTGDLNKENGTVDGVTGATRSSDAIEVIVNNELQSFPL